MTRPDQVLYLDTASGLGGARSVSLFELLRGLDRDCYEPVVVAYANHAPVDKIRDLRAGVVVRDSSHVLDYRPKWVSSARYAHPARLLGRSGWGAPLYGAAGLRFYFARFLRPGVRALRRIMDEKQVRLAHTNIRVGHDRRALSRLGWLGGLACHVRDLAVFIAGGRPWLAGSSAFRRLCKGTILSQAGAVPTHCIHSKVRGPLRLCRA